MFQTELSEMELKKKKMVEQMMKRKQEQAQNRAKLDRKRQRKAEEQQWVVLVVKCIVNLCTWKNEFSNNYSSGAIWN